MYMGTSVLIFYPLKFGEFGFCVHPSPAPFPSIPFPLLHSPTVVRIGGKCDFWGWRRKRGKKGESFVC